MLTVLHGGTAGSEVGAKAHFWPKKKQLLFTLHAHNPPDGPNPMGSYISPPVLRQLCIPDFRFSGWLPFIWPLSWHLLAPIAQSNPWQGQKWPKINFLGLSLNIVSDLGEALFRVKMSHFVSFFVHFEKLIRRPPGPLCLPTFSQMLLHNTASFRF